MLGRGVAIVLLLVRIARADGPAAPAEPDPAEGPTFVTVLPWDATSRVGAQYTYVDQVNAKPIHRFDLHAHYVASALRVGGYIDIPYTWQRSGVERAGLTGGDVWGNLQLGALWVPRLPVAHVGLVAHAGVALPIDEAGDLGTRGALLAPHELYAGFRDTTSMRAGVSMLARYKAVFARLDLGGVGNARSDVFPTSILSAYFNAAVGITSRAGLSFGLELATIDRLSDEPFPEPLALATSFDDTNVYGTFALSIRYRRGPVQIYAANVTPLRQPQRQFARGAFTLGVECAL